MKKFSVLAGAVAISCLAGTAQAQNWYAGGFGAMNYTHDGYANGTDLMTYKLGFGLGAMAGASFSNGFRLEGEMAYRANDIDTIAGIAVGADITSFAVMGNVLYDFQTQSSVKPHIGGGLGVADATVEIGGVQYSDTVLAAQFIGGIDYKIAPDMAMVIDYRLFMTDELGLGAGSGLGGVEYTNSTISVGLRKSF